MESRKNAMAAFLFVSILSPAVAKEIPRFALPIAEIEGVTFNENAKPDTLSYTRENDSTLFLTSGFAYVKTSSEIIGIGSGEKSIPTVLEVDSSANDTLYGNGWLMGSFDSRELQNFSPGWAFTFKKGISFTRGNIKYTSQNRNGKIDFGSDGVSISNFSLEYLVDGKRTVLSGSSAE